jgi:hypothetical protein
MNPPVIINQAYVLFMAWLPAGSDRSEAVDAPVELIVGWRYASPTNMVPITTNGEVGGNHPHVMVGLGETRDEAREGLAQIL